MLKVGSCQAYDYGTVILVDINFEMTAAGVCAYGLPEMHVQNVEASTLRWRTQFFEGGGSNNMTITRGGTTTNPKQCRQFLVQPGEWTRMRVTIIRLTLTRCSEVTHASNQGRQSSCLRNIY